MFSIARIIPLSLLCYLGAIETRELAGGRHAGMSLSIWERHSLWLLIYIERVTVTSKHGFDFM